MKYGINTDYYINYTHDNNTYYFLSTVMLHAKHSVKLCTYFIEKDKYGDTFILEQDFEFKSLSASERYLTCD